MLKNFISWLSLKIRNGNFGLIARLLTWASYADFAVTLKKKKARSSTRLSVRATQMFAEIERAGFCVVQGYWTSEQCAAARAEVERTIAQYPAYVHPHPKADYRVFGADRVSEIIARFNRDPDLSAVASAYNGESTEAAFTLAALMPYTVGNRGSGEGWHRDAFLRQIKAIIYLSDAGPDNGPFQLIRDSHRCSQILNDMKMAHLTYMQNRLDEQQVAKLVDQDPERLLTFTALAGTLILVDTSAIHRGMPINAGIRYALTNYYYPKNRVNKAMYEKFHVLPKPDLVPVTD